VTARGDRRENINDDDIDRERFLAILGQAIEDFNWVCHAYCLMCNHYYLLIETADVNLSKGMRQLNNVFTAGIESSPSAHWSLVPGAIQGNFG
jgi:putative transposase